jgi:hypothetical protein
VAIAAFADEDLNFTCEAVMRILCAGLVIGLVALSGCTESNIDHLFGQSEARNGNIDDECLHAGNQGTGYVVNCNRHNDDRNDELERPR